MTRYTYSSPGVKSMMRLGVMWTLALATALIGTGLVLFISGVASNSPNPHGIQLVGLGSGLVPIALGAKFGQKAVEK